MFRRHYQAESTVGRGAEARQASLLNWSFLLTDNVNDASSAVTASLERRSRYSNRIVEKLVGSGRVVSKARSLCLRLLAAHPVISFALGAGIAVALSIGLPLWTAASALTAIGVVIAAMVPTSRVEEEEDSEKPMALASPPPQSQLQDILVTEPVRLPAQSETSPPERSDKSWRSVIDAISDPALVLDAAGVIVHHNPLAVELFPRVRIGLPISHISRSPELLQAVDRAQGAERRIMVQLQDRVPVQRRVSAILSPLAIQDFADGGPAILVTFRDITDQEKLAQMRADFISYASHELRTPLASLRGFVETLQGPARNDPVARERFLGIMAAQATRMTRLIDDLLSLSRIEMRVHVPPRGQVELNETIGFVAQTLEPLAEGSQIRINVTKLPTPAVVRGDREELVQVFQNLVQNAIKYGRIGGHVEVRLQREPRSPGQPQQISVAVIDDGAGIAPEHLPRLTERFYRANAATSREKGGTGLGLAIVKYIVNRHRGELKIASEVGVGSTFTIVLDELAQG